jgi:MFS family permease
MLPPHPIGMPGLAAFRRIVIAHSIERPYGWVVALAAMVMMTVAMGAPYVVIVALKPIAAEFDWPRAVPSLCYSLTMIGAGCGGVLMGRWADRAGMGPPALVGACSIPLGTWLASTAQDALTLYVAHGLFIGLLGNGAFVAPLLAHATRWFDRRRGMAVAVVASGQPLAGALWPPFLRWLIDDFGWRTAFTTYATIALLLLLPLALVVRADPPKPVVGGPHDGGDWDGRTLGWPGEAVLVMLCLAIVGCCVAMAMPMVHLIAHATDLGYESARAAEMLALLLACAFLSRLAFGWLADRIGGLWALFIGTSGQAVMLASFAWVQSFLGLYVIAALFGVIYGGIVPMYALIVRELYPARQAGWRIGTVIMFGALGMALGGWLGGFIFDVTGTYRVAFLVGVTFNLGNLLLVGALLHRQQAGRLQPA